MRALYSRISNFRNWNALINLLFLRQKLLIAGAKALRFKWLWCLKSTYYLIKVRGAFSYYSFPLHFSTRQLLSSEFCWRSRRQWNSWIILPWIFQIATMALFGSFKEVYDKVFTTEAVNIDNIVFKLHYQVTVTALVIFSIVLSLGQVSINILYGEFWLELFEEFCCRLLHY